MLTALSPPEDEIWCGASIICGYRKVTAFVKIADPEVAKPHLKKLLEQQAKKMRFELSLDHLVSIYRSRFVGGDLVDIQWVEAIQFKEMKAIARRFGFSVPALSERHVSVTHVSRSERGCN